MTDGTGLHHAVNALYHEKREKQQVSIKLSESEIATRVEELVKGQTRTFDTGATRDTEEGKLDYEGFYSPLTLRRYAQYMHKHRKQSDGKMRDSDNWQKGIPLTAYMKSLWRHLVDLWTAHRSLSAVPEREDALCAIIFNASGYLHELLKAKEDKRICPNDPCNPCGKNWLGLEDNPEEIAKGRSC